MHRSASGTERTCYDTALADSAEIVVMLHPDYQYRCWLNGATTIVEVLAICMNALLLTV
jgi:hypothetical protein